MVDLSIILAGLGDVLTVTNFAFVLAGVVLGQFVGAVPGIGPIMAMAIAIPFTFGLDPLPAIAFLVGVNKGGLVGGAIPSILINTPGTPDAAATALDGYPLARQGKAVKATRMALFSSVTGDTISDLVLVTVAAPLAVLALRMGPVEILALMICAFCTLTTLLGDSPIKGVISACIGLLLASVGTDPEHYSPRLIFGIYEFYDGLPLASVAIGMLAVAEIIRRLAANRGRIGSTAEQRASSYSVSADRLSFAEFWSCRLTLLRGAGIGTLLGALPGIGSTAAAFMSYAMAKAAAKNPDSFGKGNIQGIAATESANSAVMGANLIPLLTLGIPGSVSAALIVTAFMIHGIQPGPLLFENQARLVYGLFGAMIMANFVNLWVGQIGLRFWIKVVSAPESVILSVALLLCITGVSLSTGGLFGVAVMLAFAALGFVLSSLGFSLIILIIAFFLGDQFEKSLAQTLALTDGQLTMVLNYPIAVMLLVLSIVITTWRPILASLGNRSRAAQSK